MPWPVHEQYCIITFTRYGLAYEPSTIDTRQQAVGIRWPDLRREFSLDSSVAHLNHGSFGAVPIPVQRFQDELRRRVE